MIIIYPFVINTGNTKKDLIDLQTKINGCMQAGFILSGNLVSDGENYIQAMTYTHPLDNEL